MSALFFGHSDQQLFGVYHEPQGSEPRDTAVLICNPIGFEYDKAHYVIRQLANRLSALGYHVFRFDYFGTGDSSGSNEDLSIERCILDVKMAQEELVHLSGIKKLSIIGLRFGAVIGTYAAQIIKVRRLILWDPVLDGELTHMRIKRMHRTMLSRHPSRFFSKKGSIVGENELIGYRFSENWENDIIRVKIENIEKSNVKSKRMDVSLVLDEKHQINDLEKLMPNSESILSHAERYFEKMQNDWYDTEKIAIRNLLDGAFERVVALMK